MRSDRKSSDTADDETAKSEVPSFKSILKERGLLHEKNALNRLKTDGADVLECLVSRYDLEEKAALYLANGALERDVVYQMPFVHEGIRGIADFVIRDGDRHLAVDAKLARKEAKPGHVLQLCFYTDAIEEATGRRPTHIEIWLGGLGEDGNHRVERHRIKDVDAYWRQMKKELKRAIDSPIETVAEPCSHCQFCEFADRCNEEWVQKDSVHFVSGVTKRDRAKLALAGIEMRSDLASLKTHVDGMEENRLARLCRQAELQVEALPRLDEVPEDFPNSSMRIEFNVPDPEEPLITGLHALPPPDEGDLFLDYEGHPFWTVEEGLIFLFGLHFRKNGEWVYEDWWAHSKEDERNQANALVRWVAERRVRHPGMHVYHYNHTERSNLASLVRDGGSDELGENLDQLKTEGIFVDLLQIIRKGIQVGVPSYGLKNIEKVAGYRRPVDDSVGRGADAVTYYEAWMQSGAGALAHPLLESIREYNEEDVVATRYVRDWLLSLRAPAGVTEWPVLTEGEEIKPLDAEEAYLVGFPVGTAERLLGDVLGYWERERRKQRLDQKVALESAAVDIFADEKTIGRAQSIEIVPPRGKQQGSRLRVGWPPQPVSSEFQPSKSNEAKVVVLLDDGRVGFSAVEELGDSSAVIKWPSVEGEVDYSLMPQVAALYPDSYVDPKKKKAQLYALAQTWVNAGAAPSSLSQAILKPLFPPTPTGGLVAEARSLAEYISGLKGYVLPVQGPPGTGKTYTGAEIIARLLESSTTMRIGVCATSNAAVNNFLESLLKSLTVSEHGRVGRLGDVKSLPPGLKVAAGPDRESRQVVLGTAFGLCNLGTKGSHFDVVFIDEAGQMSLADALAVSHCSDSMVLLGDPLQLPQVSQASHPNGSGASVLVHFLGQSATVGHDRGVFLDTSRRMHPSICKFISEWRYEDKLSWDQSCSTLATTVDSLTDQGVGLRVRLLDHTGNQVRSQEEVDAVIEIVNQALGKTWTNNEGETAVIGSSDVLVVAPFNAQRRAIKEALESNANTKDVEVGTVDKFQGREAAIVVFSMAASSADDLPRGADFLFDSNRLNVAISRAKCLAFIVCNESLLSSRARSVEQMKLISGLCSFVEAAVPI